MGQHEAFFPEPWGGICDKNRQASDPSESLAGTSRWTHTPFGCGGLSSTRSSSPSTERSVQRPGSA